MLYMGILLPTSDIWLWQLRTKWELSSFLEGSCSILAKFDSFESEYELCVLEDEFSLQVISASLMLVSLFDA